MTSGTRWCHVGSMFAVGGGAGPGAQGGGRCGGPEPAWASTEVASPSLFPRRVCFPCTRVHPSKPQLQRPLLHDALLGNMEPSPPRQTQPPSCLWPNLCAPPGQGSTGSALTVRSSCLCSTGHSPSRWASATSPGSSRCSAWGWAAPCSAPGRACLLPPGTASRPKGQRAAVLAAHEPGEGWLAAGRQPAHPTRPWPASIWSTENPPCPQHGAARCAGAGTKVCGLGVALTPPAPTTTLTPMSPPRALNCWVHASHHQGLLRDPDPRAEQGQG